MPSLVGFLCTEWLDDFWNVFHAQKLKGPSFNIMERRKRMAVNEKKKGITGDNLVPGVLLSSRQPRDRGRPPHPGTSDLVSVHADWFMQRAFSTQTEL